MEPGGARQTQEATTKEIQDSVRELQLIVTGLQEAEDEEDVIKQVKEAVEAMGAGNKYIDICVFTDPSKI